MNKEDILRMAATSNIALYGLGLPKEKFISHLEIFAKLVAEHEREACAKLRETLHPFDLHNRSEMLGVMNQGLDDYQNLIRARGQA